MHAITPIIAKNRSKRIVGKIVYEWGERQLDTSSETTTRIPVLTSKETLDKMCSTATLFNLLTDIIIIKNVIKIK